jgi:hypothetical protein
MGGDDLPCPSPHSVSPLVRRRRSRRRSVVRPNYDRLKLVGLGVLLGFVWGTLLWGITSAAGQSTGAKGWIYIALTCAMIGGGVAGIFGAFAAKKRGERIGPKIRLPFRRRS